VSTEWERHRAGNSQFGKPRGAAGWVAGQMMAVLNAGMIERAVALLDVQPEDTVLEIGFGAGTLIRRAAQRATRGFVAGIDVSDVMLRQAMARNRAAIRAGRVELRVAGVSRIPYPDARFDKVCAVNSFQFWPQPADDLAEVRRVLRPGGLLALALHGRSGPDDPGMNRIGFTEAEVRGVRELLHKTGFVCERAERAKVRFQVGEFLVARNQ
jgi:ubiquinone/menaquinone biosynthesis C-methylase UbiE